MPVESVPSQNFHHCSRVWFLSPLRKPPPPKGDIGPNSTEVGWRRAYAHKGLAHLPMSYFWIPEGDPSHAMLLSGGGVPSYGGGGVLPWHGRPPPPRKCELVPALWGPTGGERIPLARACPRVVVDRGPPPGGLAGGG